MRRPGAAPEARDVELGPTEEAPALDGGWLARRGPHLLVALVCGYLLWLLRAEVIPVQNLNDEVLHHTLIEWASHRIKGGHLPLDGWMANLSLGSSQPHHYQALPHILTAYVGQVLGTVRTWHWVLYLGLALWPVCVYWGARLLGFNRWSAAGAAAVAPWLMSEPVYGYEYDMYVWQGYGVWSQLWGMWLLPLSMGCSWRAVNGEGSKALAAALVALTIACHFITGYLALLVIGVFVLVAAGKWLTRLARAAAIGVGGVLIASWAIVPLVLDSRWGLRSEIYPGTYYYDSFGARKVLGWLFTGQLYDKNRFPILSILVAVGLVVCVRRCREDRRARAVLGVWLLSLVLFFGRPTLGPLLNLLPGAKDIFLHRYISGVQLAGVFMAGVGIDWMRTRLVGRWSARAPGTRPAVLSVATIVAVIVVVSPAWWERTGYHREGARLIRTQQAAERTDGADLVRVIDEVKRRGGGRVYAGASDNWGRQYAVFSVPVYAVLVDQGVDSIGYWLRTQSLATDVEDRFNYEDPQQYDLFNVRYLILPYLERQPPKGVPATFIMNVGRHGLWEVRTTGYLDVVDTDGTLSADRGSVGRDLGPFLLSEQLDRRLYPTIEFGGLRAEPPTVGRSGTVSGPAGLVESQLEQRNDGRFGGTIVANRLSAVLLKASYDPRWTAKVDGVEAKVYPVAPIYNAVTVSPGRHTVEFVYEGFPRYDVLLLIGLLTLLALVLGPRWWARRLVSTASSGRGSVAARPKPARPQLAALRKAFGRVRRRGPPPALLAAVVGDQEPRDVERQPGWLVALVLAAGVSGALALVATLAFGAMFERETAELYLYLLSCTLVPGAGLATVLYGRRRRAMAPPSAVAPLGIAFAAGLGLAIAALRLSSGTQGGINTAAVVALGVMVPVLALLWLAVRMRTPLLEGAPRWAAVEPARMAAVAVPLIVVGAAASFAPTIRVADLDAARVAFAAGALVLFAGIGERFARRVPRLAFDLAATALVTSLVVSLNPVINEVARFHLNYYLGPVNDVVSGKSVLVDTFSQYGALVIDFFAAALGPGPLPVSYAGAGVLVGVLMAAQYLGIYALLRMLLPSRVAALGAVLGAMAVNSYTYCQDCLAASGRSIPPIEWNYFGFPSVGAARFGLPFALLLAVMVRVRRPERQRALSIVEGAILAVAAVWSFETFFYTATAYAAVLSAELLAGGDRRTAARRAAGAVVAVLGAHVLFAGATRVGSGSWPDWSHYLEYVTKYSGGYFSLPAAAFAPWPLVAGMYLVSLLAVAVLCHNGPALVARARGELSVVAGLAGCGLASFSYYVGRSHPTNLRVASIPAVLLGAYWWSRLRASSSLPRGTHVVANVGFVLVLGLALYDAQPSVATKLPMTLFARMGHVQQDLDLLRDPQPSDVRVREALGLIARHAADRDRVVLIMTPDLTTETLLFSGKSNVFPIANPYQDSDLPRATALVRRFPHGLGAGDVIFWEQAGELVAPTRAAIEVLQSSFSFNTIETSANGVSAIRLERRT